MATCQTNNQMRYMRRTMPDTSCPCHETVPMNGCPNTRDFFPANMPIAMAYVPWQKWQNIYEPCRDPGDVVRIQRDDAALLKTERSLRN